MADAPARVDLRDIANFLAETQSLTPEEQAHYRQQYFDKYVLQHWNTFSEQQRHGLNQAFNFGLEAPLKMPGVSAEADYRRDVMARGGNPNDPKQSGGGAVGLGSTAQSVGDKFMESGIPAAAWEAGPFGGTSSMADPMGWGAGIARGALAGARLPAQAAGSGLRGLTQMLMNPNPMLQRGAMQVVKDMATKGAEWGSAGMLPLAYGIGRGLWRRLPFGQGGGAAMARPGVPSAMPEAPAAAAASEAAGAAPRPRVRYGPDEAGQPQITLPY